MPTGRLSGVPGVPYHVSRVAGSISDKVDSTNQQSFSNILGGMNISPPISEALRSVTREG